jgi:hypothetical protein
MHEKGKKMQAKGICLTIRSLIIAHKILSTPANQLPVSCNFNSDSFDNHVPRDLRSLDQKKFKRKYKAHLLDNQ